MKEGGLRRRATKLESTLYFEGRLRRERALQGSTYMADKAGADRRRAEDQADRQRHDRESPRCSRPASKGIVISAGPRQAASLVGVAAAAKLNVPVIGNNSAFAPQLLAARRDPRWRRTTGSPPVAADRADTAEAKKLVADYRKGPTRRTPSTTASSRAGPPRRSSASPEEACETGPDPARGVDRRCSPSAPSTRLGVDQDFSDPRPRPPTSR